jgi:hypothetical protein
MIKKYLSIALICWILVTANSMLISAQSQADKTASSIAKVKAAVLKRKTGENKRVKVIMLNGTDLKGYISQAGQDSFELTDSKTKQSSSIFYRDVKKVRGNGLSKTAIISLGGIGAAAAVVLYIVLAPICNEGGC